ncbi:hypothetical protein CSV86_013405 [Pseudomonas putida CSV86]|uniref:Uncharacterized protein n=1 Tax=Pseudomonas bharatica CSV86 TaxID=1005395 RepID=A0A7K4EES8_9PSED|nr:hypothetical protein [Pseudomonas bharatica]NNJ16155.1 hypothetical protein [Pseudomonas bharatica CSV86]
MKNFFPDLYSDLVPGTSAAGFHLGESLSSVSEKIGLVEWYGPEVMVRDILAKNNSWVGVQRKIGFGEERTLSYRFLNETVSLYFEGSGRLFRITVGERYRGRFNGVAVGDDLRSLGREFDILFNDAEDDFILQRGEDVLMGISFFTDHMAPLDVEPKQFIKFISIHDWSVR